MKTRNANALIFTLGLIFAASIIAVEIVGYSTNALKTRASSAFESELRRDAYSALYASMAVLSEYFEIDKNIYAAEQGWEKPLEDNRIKFDNGTVAEVKISDESGKLPLSDLSADELTRIFEEMQISSSDAQEMADSIIDWSDSDTAELPNGAEEEEYLDGEPKPPNRPIQSFEEFKYINKVKEVFFDENGKPLPIFEEFTKGISLEHFNKVNLNSSPPETLKMMLDIEGKDYDPDLHSALKGKIGQVSDGITWVTNLAELNERTSAEVPTKRRTFTAQLLKIEVKIKRGIGEYYLCAYYAEKGAATINKNKTKAVYSAQETSKSSTKNGTSSSISTTPISVCAPYIKTDSSSSGKSKTSSKSSSVLKGSYTIIKLYERGNSQ